MGGAVLSGDRSFHIPPRSTSPRGARLPRFLTLGLKSPWPRVCQGALISGIGQRPRPVGRRLHESCPELDSLLCNCKQIGTVSQIVLWCRGNHPATYILALTTFPASSGSAIFPKASFSWRCSFHRSSLIVHASGLASRQKLPKKSHFSRSRNRGCYKFSAAITSSITEILGWRFLVTKNVPGPSIWRYRRRLRE